MTTAINRPVEFNAQPSAQIAAKPTSVGKFTTFLQGQFKTGGLFGDFANCLKLMNFWTESIHGTVTESSKKMTNAGSLIKNYIGVLEFPDKVSTVAKNWEGLKKGTTESVADFAEAVFGMGKSFFDGVELAGTRFGLLSKEVVTFLSPLSAAGAFSFGANQAIFKNVPAMRENLEEKKPENIASTLLKLVKHTALAVVGALSLIATFFLPIQGLGVIIPSLLTVYITASISGRFFDGLVLSPKSNPI